MRRCPPHCAWTPPELEGSPHGVDERVVEEALLNQTCGDRSSASKAPHRVVSANPGHCQSKEFDTLPSNSTGAKLQRNNVLQISVQQRHSVASAKDLETKAVRQHAPWNVHRQAVAASRKARG
jgi:hypothetical protein